jgi:hypothetical protein
MAKTLCDWSKSDLKKHPERLMELVRDPRYYCRRCARVAHTSKVLCKPKKFKSPAPDS